MRDNGGRFLAGVKHGLGGRPTDSGKFMVKDMAWNSINKVAWLIFNLPEQEMKLWVESNRHTLSVAERLYIEAAQINLGVIEAILDRIIGKTLKIDSGNTEKDPVIEKLYELSPGNVKKEIDRMIKNRNVIHAEFNRIEAKKD